MIGDLKECGLGLVELLSQHLSEGTEEENHEKSQFGQPISQLRVKPNAS
jgi:hypothetical protein